MALETVVDYSQDPFSYYSFKDFYSLLGGSSNFLGYNDDQEFDQEDKPSLVGTTMDGHANNWEDFNNMTTTTPSDHHHHHHHHRQLGGVDYNTPNHSSPEPGPAAIGRRKRRRARSGKNKEEIETQRMTHIAVERNRRRQMNEYLAVLRSLMPPSYVHRGDQASIVGGAINFVKELEQLLQSMEGHNHKRCHGHDHGHDHDQNPSNDKAGRHGLAEFFTFPQYSTRGNSTSTSAVPAVLQASESQSQNKSNDDHWAVADIEVTMVDSHANLKILAKKRPRLLLRLATGLQALGLGILHLNVTTADQMVLYSVSVKVEEGCQLNTVDEIASAVNQMLRRIQDEPAFN